MNGNPFDGKHMGRKQLLTRGSTVREIECGMMEAQRRMWRGEKPAFVSQKDRLKSANSCAVKYQNDPIKLMKSHCH